MRRILVLLILLVSLAVLPGSSAFAQKSLAEAMPLLMAPGNAVAHKTLAERILLFALPVPVRGNAIVQKSLTETMPLRFIKPSLVVETLRKPVTVTVTNNDGTTKTSPSGYKPPLLLRGIQWWSPNDRAMTLMVCGTAEAVARVKEMVRLIDVQPGAAGLQDSK